MRKMVASFKCRRTSTRRDQYRRAAWVPQVKCSRHRQAIQGLRRLSAWCRLGSELRARIPRKSLELLLTYRIAGLHLFSVTLPVWNDGSNSTPKVPLWGRLARNFGGRILRFSRGCLAKKHHQILTVGGDRLRYCDPGEWDSVLSQLHASENVA